jgi:hypothetical protein
MSPSLGAVSDLTVAKFCQIVSSGIRSQYGLLTDLPLTTELSRLSVIGAYFNLFFQTFFFKTSVCTTTATYVLLRWKIDVYCIK